MSPNYRSGEIIMCTMTMTTTTPTIYLDMDGVVADWDAGVSRITGQLPPQHTHTRDQPGDYSTWGYQHWPVIRLHPRIYRDLPLVRGCGTLVNLARQLRDQWNYNLLFLTAVPRNNDFPWAFSDKVYWANQHFPDIPVHFGPYSRDKHQHCRNPGDILIDDRWSNVEEWRRAGGTAVHIITNQLNPAVEFLEDLLSQHQREAPAQEIALEDRYLDS